MLNTPGQDDHDGDLELSFEGLDRPDDDDDCVPLDDEREQVGYELFEWAPDELDALDDVLHRERIPHEWVSEGYEVVVHAEDEGTVDSLLPTVRPPDDLHELPAEDDDGSDVDVLNPLFVAADRLRRDPTGDGVAGFLDAAELIGDTPPYGVEGSVWDRVTDVVDELIDAYQSGAPDEVIEALVDRLYRFVRPLV